MPRNVICLIHFICIKVWPENWKIFNNSKLQCWRRAMTRKFLRQVDLNKSFPKWIQDFCSAFIYCPNLFSGQTVWFQIPADVCIDARNGRLKVTFVLPVLSATMIIFYPKHNFSSYIVLLISYHLEFHEIACQSTRNMQKRVTAMMATLE